METIVFQLLHQVIEILNLPKKTIDQLIKIIDLSYENDIDLHGEQNKKKGKISIKGYSLSSLAKFKKILEELKKNQNTMILKIWYMDSN